MSPNSMLRRALCAWCLVSLSLVAVAADTAAAAPHHPTGQFARFSDCPLSRPTLTDCIFVVVDGGSMTVGEVAAPITNPMILQGGFEGAGSEIQFFGAEDGATISRTRTPVPGGLIGLSRERFADIEPNAQDPELWATLELAAPANEVKVNTENLIFEEGVAITLPVKLHLEGSLLSSNCYLGSNAQPIVLHLTSAVSGRLRGTTGELTFGNELFTISELHGARLVDGTFAVPRASDCGEAFGFPVDPLVNSLLGTPSAPGENSVALEGEFWDAASSAVIESEAGGAGLVSSGNADDVPIKTDESAALGSEVRPSAASPGVPGDGEPPGGSPASGPPQPSSTVPPSVSHSIPTSAQKCRKAGTKRAVRNRARCAKVQRHREGRTP